MNELKKVPFAYDINSDYSLKENPSSLINLMSVKASVNSKSNYYLIGTEGYMTLKKFDSKILNIFEHSSGDIYIASETQITEYKDGIFSVIGVVSFTDKVFIASNGNDIVFVSSNGYYYRRDTMQFGNMDEFAGWYPADTVAFLDGYFVFNRQATGQFFISKLYDVEIDPLDWATAEAAPDDTVAVVVSNNLLWLFGKNTTEVWYDSGDPLFPFTRIAGSTIGVGAVSHRTIAKVQSEIIFVGNDLIVYVTNGTTIKRVSSTTVEHELSKNNYETSKVSSFSYFIDSLWKFVIHTEKKTMMLCLNTGLWNYMQSEDNPDRKKWFIEGATRLSKTKVIYGYTGSKMVVLSTDVGSEDGLPIYREATTINYNNGGVNPFVIAEMQLEVEALNGNGTMDLTLNVSKDGGYFFGADRIAAVPNTINARKRTKWNMLGYFRDAVFKVSTTSTELVRLIGCYVRVK